MGSELLISKTRVKAFLKQCEVRVSPQFYEAFNEDLKTTLLKIAKRAKGNKRTTVLNIDA